MSTGDRQCPYCGIWNPQSEHVATCWIGRSSYGSYTFTPTPLTADDIRRIVREELERAAIKEQP